MRTADGRCATVDDGAEECERVGECGFTLLELLLCVAVLAMASAATIGAFAAVARNATPGPARDVALMAAENVLARVRAAAAYAPSSTEDPATVFADRSWALAPGTTHFVAGAQLRANAICGNGGGADGHASANAGAGLRLRLPVVTSFDVASERFSVTVTYPRDPCRVGADGTIPDDDAATLSLGETLPPSVYAPGRTIHRDVAPPARM